MLYILGKKGKVYYKGIAHYKHRCRNIGTHPNHFFGKKRVGGPQVFPFLHAQLSIIKKMNLNRVRNLFSLDTTCFSLANAQKYSEGIKKRMAELQLLLILPNRSVRVVIQFFFIHSIFSLCALYSSSSILSVDQT